MDRQVSIGKFTSCFPEKVQVILGMRETKFVQPSSPRGGAFLTVQVDSLSWAFGAVVDELIDERWDSLNRSQKVSTSKAAVHKFTYSKKRKKKERWKKSETSKYLDKFIGFQMQLSNTSIIFWKTYSSFYIELLSQCSDLK